MGSLRLGGYSLLSGLCGENMERSERNCSVVRKDPGQEEKGVGSGSGWITTLTVEQSYCGGSASDGASRSSAWPQWATSVQSEAILETQGDCAAWVYSGRPSRAREE